MKRTIVAILALTPAVLFAQAKSPAQPSSTPLLQSALLQPVAFASDTAPTAVTATRISTGVVAPRLTHSANVQLPTDSWTIAANDRKFVVDMIVDKSGTPTNLKLVQTADTSLNEQVLGAVSRFHYQPGTLDGQPAEVPVRLEVTVPHGAAY